ncbi:MAG: DNA-binding protein WhiA, partial [Clostridia bacterium]|nr:DNA-binding protein WhiA [Clostridia bacterium]
MSFPHEGLRDVCLDVLASHGIEAKRGVRRSNFTLYIKDSETIGDFLAFAGATEAVFDLINLKLMREASIAINRQNNFETANIKKTVKANIVYMEAVKYLIDSGNFDSLPDDLRSTAALRIENDTASMSELGRLHSPSISKSGVKHRLDKLLQIANSIKEKK